MDFHEKNYQNKDYFNIVRCKRRTNGTFQSHSFIRLRSLKYPHNKRSKQDKSGEFGGQCICQRNLPNLLLTLHNCILFKKVRKDYTKEINEH